MKRSVWIRGLVARIGVAGVCIIGVAGLVSCVTPTEGIPTTVATEQNDLPVPVDFEFDSSRSYSTEPRTTIPEARFRSWHGYYRGPGDPSKLESWYLEEMQQFGWKPASIEDRNRKLVFTKGEEFAEVQLSREIDPSLGKYVNIVRISVRPLGPEDFDVQYNLQRLDEAGVRTLTAPIDEPRNDPAESAAVSTSLPEDPMDTADTDVAVRASKAMKANANTIGTQ